LQEFASKNSGEVRIPGMAMNDVSFCRGLGHFDIPTQVMEHFDVRVTIIDHFGQRRVDSAYLHRLCIFVLVTKATYFNLT
jgi:hypothetical protein